MSIKHSFGRASFLAILAVALCASLSYAAHGGGGGGGGRSSGGWSGGRAAWSGGYVHPGNVTPYSGNRFNSGTVNQFNSGTVNRFNSNTFNSLHANTAGQWYGHNNAWGNYYHHGGWGWGGYWPWYAGWGLGLGWGWGYPYAYSYYYPDANDYYYSYAPADYGVVGPAAPTVTEAPQPPAEPSPLAATTENPQPGADEALQYYSEARAAFLAGDYRNALRLAGHAGVEAPGNPKIHELTSLALFALGKYGPAASEAHAAMALGDIAQWKDLYGYYNDVDKYTAQLRALEKAAKGNGQSAAEHFLLGYHYLMIGARKNAQTELAAAAKLTPDDKLAGHYLRQLQSNGAIKPPETASRPQGQAF